MVSPSHGPNMWLRRNMRARRRLSGSWRIAKGTKPSIADVSRNGMRVVKNERMRCLLLAPDPNIPAVPGSASPDNRPPFGPEGSKAAEFGIDAYLNLLPRSPAAA